MSIIDPIRPYLALIRLALWCLLACGLFVAGCQRGESMQEGKTAKAQAELRAYQAKMIDATDRAAKAAAAAKTQYDIKAAEAARSYADGRKSAEMHEATVVADLRSGNLRLRNEWAACMSRSPAGQAGPAADRADGPAAVSAEAFGRVLRVGSDADAQVSWLQSQLMATRKLAESCGAAQ